MTVKPIDLISLRNEYSLLSYGPRCFAIIFGESKFLQDLKSYVKNINEFSPHRVYLCLSELNTQHAANPFVVVEMKNKTRVHQMYFTYLMWQFSATSPVWIHIWDTLEHDALRRDFEAPKYMDSELSINRLWLKNQSVFLIEERYSKDNPHGEYVPELRLAEAMKLLQEEKFVNFESLSTQLIDRFSGTKNPHLLEHVSDIENVYISKSLAYLVARYPNWIEHPDFELFDPTHIQLDAIPDCIDLQDEIKFTVALSDLQFSAKSNQSGETEPELFKNSLSTAQWVSIMIKVNANKAFYDAKSSSKETEKLMSLVGKDVATDCFSSSFLMSKVSIPESAVAPKPAKFIKNEDSQVKRNWRSPVNVLTAEESGMYENLQRESYGDAEPTDNINPSQSNDNPDDQQKSFFTGLEDTTDFTRDFANSDLLKNISAAIEDPNLLLETSQALTEEDLEKTANLEDFDDFVEFYARQFLGYKDEDLERHRVGELKEANDREVPVAEPAFDWEAYNDDSEYESGGSSEEEGGW